jgi:hypothetical protein
MSGGDYKRRRWEKSETASSYTGAKEESAWKSEEAGDGFSAFGVTDAKFEDEAKEEVKEEEATGGWDKRASWTTVGWDTGASSTTGGDLTGRAKVETEDAKKRLEEKYTSPPPPVWSLAWQPKNVKKEEHAVEEEWFSAEEGEVKVEGGGGDPDIVEGGLDQLLDTDNSDADEQPSAADVQEPAADAAWTAWAARPLMGPARRRRMLQKKAEAEGRVPKGTLNKKSRRRQDNRYKKHLYELLVGPGPPPAPDGGAASSSSGAPTVVLAMDAEGKFVGS